MTALLSWLEHNSIIVSLLATASLLIMIVSILAAPWAVSKLPVDCLVHTQPATRSKGAPGVLIMIIRNLLGAPLIVLGIIMLITPGPGLVLILLGLIITSFPGKQQLILRIGCQKTVFQTLNWMRARHQQPPLIYPGK